MRISDWSSDVCSSDLHAANTLSPIPFGRHISVCSSSSPVDFAALGFDVAWLRPGEPLSVSLAAGIARAEATACEACLIVLSDMPFVPRSRSEEHTSELQSLMRISYAVFCSNKTNLHTQLLQA